jgi:hypothetical protein
MATQTLLNLASHQYPAGTFTSQTYTVPAGVSVVEIKFTLSAADAADSTKSMIFECDRFDVASQTWKFDHGFTWQGGSINPKTGQFFNPIGQGVDGLSEGQQLRAVVTPNAPLTAAILVTAQ